VLLVDVELDSGIVDELFLLVPSMGMVFMGCPRALVPVDADGSRPPTLDASSVPSSPAPAKQGVVASGTERRFPQPAEGEVSSPRVAESAAAGLEGV
jgi:hypothetical protein